MRKRFRLTVLGLAVLMLSGVGVLVARTMWQQRKEDVLSVGLEFLPGVSQHIQDFHRVKLQDGRKVWEVAAEDAQYLDEEKTVVVRGAMVQLFLKDGRALGLKGDEGQITFDGRDVTRADLRGDIRVTLADYVVRTDRATYDHTRRLISTPGAVEIAGRALRVRGDRMEVQVSAERLTLLHNVSMQVYPALLKQGGAEAPL